MTFKSMADFYRVGEPYAGFPQEHRAGGTLGVGMVEVHQGAVEVVDPAVPALTLVACLDGGGSGEFDFGDGWRRHEFRRGAVDPQPAFAEVGLRIPPVHLLGLSIDHAALAARLDEVGVAASALDALGGSFEPMPHALAMMEGAWRAMAGGGASANLAVDGAVTSLVGAMLARVERLPPPPPPVGDARIARVLDLMEARLADPLTVGELAEVATVSLFHFARVFRDAVGQPPHAYLTTRRVARARLLLAGPLPLAQIAYECGFASQSHFGQVFRAHIGATPGAYRAELRG